ncbi:MAG: DUF4880 domain-containing protein [Pedobacter sp.]|nr:DUF4880 domain-containing protein [Pedobacter sp.]
MLEASEHDAFQQAMRWLRLLASRDISRSERQQWLEWLDASPQHNKAWRQVEGLPG